MRWKWLWIFLSGLACASCSREVTVGGNCNITEDCHSDFNNIPGSSCVESKCVCDEPGYMHCCPGGDIENCEAQPPNDYRCRPAAECQPPDAGPTGSGGAGSGTGGATGTGGTGGDPTPPPECTMDSECAGPPDPACGAAKCVDSKCVLEIWAGPAASQLYGDCKQIVCDVFGNKSEVIDVGDFYNDGNQCTYDYCFGEVVANDPLPDGLNCPEAGDGFCYEGQCVECIDILPYASCSVAGYVCEKVWCIDFAQCQLGQCGGPCTPCPAGVTCTLDIDCLSGVCVGGMCQLPSCMDGVKNDGESGIDCGAPSCPPCPDGEGCKLPADCVSGVCKAGQCQIPSCTDAVQNGMESGIDCGGPCNPCLP